MFTTELLVRPYTVVSQDDIPSFVGWEVASPLVYNAGLGHEFSVPAGFITDFASTPRIVWWLIPPFGLYLRASVLHDWLYANGTISRARADAIFLEGMKALGVSAWKRWVMYLAVRGFGWRFFGKGAAA